MTELRATYRLQLGPGFGLAEAQALVPYLKDLGVSHLYLSPCFEARAGSTHGYDVVDPTRISAALGGEAALRELAEAGLGLILDVVPNHMATSDENPWWRDPDLRTRFFDIDPDTGRHRRFFDIDHLAGVRVEDPEVFETTQRLLIDLVAAGIVDGVRVDHPDGLADPAEYLERLRAAGVERVWVEKILEPGESLREWPVEGTTGYEFLAELTALFIDPAGERPLTELYRELTGERRSYGEIAAEAKREQLQTTFAAELDRLRRLHDAPGLAEAVASLPVYRSYVRPGRGEVDPADRQAVAAATIGDRLARVLLLEERGHDAFVRRFQQTTPAVMAKGVEDTAFYRYNRLLALNEVGGDPARFAVSVDDFHAGNAERARRFPRGLLVTQTHDTKRSADTRARISALAGMADEWRTHVMRWRELNRPLRVGGAPDDNEEYLIYQTLAGTWPIEPERLEAYVEKALREAKLNSSWANPNDAHERAVAAFCRRLHQHEPFLADFAPFAERVARAGEQAALGQLVLKLTAPGVPDIYQGDELEALALVDPDNRRPIDWERRRRALAELLAGAPPTRATMKLFVIARALELRARTPEAFSDGYLPLTAPREICAYMRGNSVLVVVALRPGWEGARLELPAPAACRWRDVLSSSEHDLGARPALAELLRHHPYALLERLSPAPYRLRESVAAVRQPVENS